MEQNFFTRVLGITGSIRYKNWGLVVGNESGSGRVYLQWKFMAPDYVNNPNGPHILWPTRKYHLSEHMTDGEIVQTAFFAAVQAEEHEAREAFSYKGKHLFNPHIDLDALMAVADKIKGRA